MNPERQLRRTRDRTIDQIWQAYRVGDAALGIRRGDEALRRHGDDGEVRFALACCLERQGRLLAADRAFAQASRATMEPQALPFRVGWARFTRAVETATAALPEPLRVALGEVTLVLADYAEPALLDGFDAPELLGLFSGTPRNELEAGGNVSPRIHLWRRAHEHQCTGRREFDDEVRQTLWHELGHYLGYDEDQLEGLGRG